MIAQLRGTLVEATPSVAVLDVSGIGFELGISGMTAAALPQLGEEVRLFTRMRVGNDAVALFGFATAEERTMFDRLIGVSSVGPRLALAVLSKYSVSQIFSIVMAEDLAGMSAVSGVGKKTAQRLILELKGSLANPWRLIKALWAWRKIKDARMIMLGVSPKFRQRGIDLILIKHIIDHGVAVWNEAELSWVLEDNEGIIRGIMECGCHPSKRYRIYQKSL